MTDAVLLKQGASSVNLCVLCVPQGRDLHDPLYLDAINSLLVAGEYPHLFTNDEMDGLLQVCTHHSLYNYVEVVPDGKTLALLLYR